MRLTILCLATVLATTHAISQIIVENDNDPTELVSNLAFTNNLEVFNITFAGDTNQFGLFNAENSNIPIDYGVVIGTGDVNNVVGPNDTPSGTLGGGNLGASDVDLEILAPFLFNDAAVLEFDFISSFDTSLTVEFVFGSEEYNTYVCSGYTDALGIFLSGPGLEGQFSNGAVNLATVPESGSPVSINSINSGVPGGALSADLCYAADSSWIENSVYFYNNEIISCPGETQLDGFTVILSNSISLIPDSTYHIKIVIADAGDTALDSAVFLKGNEVSGCTDDTAGNYDPLATSDDGSCAYTPVICGDLGAVNYGIEGECCFTESAFNVPELMGTWRLSTEYGGILVGPEPLNGDWYTGQAVGPQLDDQWTLFSNGALIYETNGTAMDPMNGYFESPLSFPILGYHFEIDAGAYGEGVLTLENPTEETCAFMGTWDSGPNYDVLELSSDTLRLVSPITNIPTCDTNLVAPGFFTLTFVHTDFESEIEGICMWGCTDETAPNFEPNATFDNGNCIQSGCTYPEALNYDPEASLDDGSCQFAGCTDETACNFNALANVDDGSCEVCTDEMSCQGDLDNDGLVSVTDLLMLLGAFGNECEPVWNCGDPVNYHGYDYPTVQIGEQCWFDENLRTSEYRNGDDLSTGLSEIAWIQADFGAQTPYDDDFDFIATYGLLYNWFAVNDSRALCPDGWHVPSDADFMSLELELGMDETQLEVIGLRGTNEGEKIKSNSTDIPSWDGTNSSGFSGLPGGSRYVGQEFPGYSSGDFVNEGSGGNFWSSTAIGNGAWYRALHSGEHRITRSNAQSQRGMSVRCIKDAE